jgi:hypothetical protein
MKLENIRFSDGENGAEPEKITVTMTLPEAIWMAKIAGKQRDESPHSGIYDCLIGDVFNRYWDDGVDEADIPFRVKIPLIEGEKP